MTSSATIGFGTLFKRGDGGGPEAFTTLAEVVSISGPSLSMDTVDVTHMESTGTYREFIPGLKDGGEVSVTLNFLPADATQNATAGILKDYNDRVLRNFQIVFPDSGNTTWTIAGYVTAFEQETPLEDKMTAEVTIKVSGEPTLA